MANAGGSGCRPDGAPRSPAKRWLCERLGLEPVTDDLLRRRVPKAPWYYGDGEALLFLFTLQVVTGIVLALTYSPTPDTAYESVRYLTEEALGGRFVRGLHYWGGGIMMVVTWVHLFRVLLVGGYKFPREGVWLTGVPLLFAVFVLSFTGYLLRWDQTAVHATTLALHMFQRLPLVGEWLVLFIQGGAQLGPQTLTRLYTVHIVFTPLLAGLFAATHVYLVIRHGHSTRWERQRPIYDTDQQRELYEREKEAEGESFYPETLARTGSAGIAPVVLVFLLAWWVGPAPLDPPGNLVDTGMPQGEWWFWWYSALIAIVPGWLAPWLLVLFPPLLFLALVLLPFVDRTPWRDLAHRPWLVGIVAASILGLLWLTYLRFESPWTAWPSDELPPAPPAVTLTETAEAGRALFNEYGCNSCHPVLGEGPSRSAPDLGTIGRRHSREEIRWSIIAPPAGAPMPRDYGARLTPEELESLLAYLEQLR